MKSRIDILRQLVNAVNSVDSYSGFNFHHVGGGLYTFESYNGFGYCYKKKDSRFKYAPAFLCEPFEDLHEYGF